MHFEIDTNAQGQWIWRLKAGNGKIVADSAESYTNRAACEHGINLVKSTDKNTPVQDLTVSKAKGLLGGLYGLKKM